MGKYSGVVNDPQKLRKYVTLAKGHIAKFADPTWELFAGTFGWYQISKDLTEEEITKVKQEWER